MVSDLKPTILLSGSLGFIYSNFVRYFYQSDWCDKYRLVGLDAALDNHCMWNFFSHPDYKFYLGNILDRHFLDKIFELEKPNIIIHGAASSFVCSSIIEPLSFIRNNIEGTQNIIDACLKHKVDKLLYCNTDELLGQLNPEDPPHKETDISNPRNYYSTTKYCAERLIYTAHQTHGLNYLITRSCNVYGPRQPSRNLFPKIIHSIVNHKPIPLHSPDGKSAPQVREWIHCLDVAKATMKILEEGEINQIYNVGTGNEVTNLDFAKLVISKFGYGEYQFVPDRLGGSDKRYAIDSSKLCSLGWQPEVQFEDGVEQAIKWYLEHEDPWLK